MYEHDGIRYYKIYLGTAYASLEARSYDASKIPLHLTIPETINGYPITSINHGAFSGAKLKTIDIPDTVWYIGKNAFRTCNDLTHVNFYESSNIKLKKFIKLCSRAFLGCNSLKEICSEVKFAKIGTQCFSDCINLQHIQAPIVELQGLALENCSSLKSILLEDNCVIASSALKGCKTLTDLMFLGNISNAVADSMLKIIKKKTIWCTADSNLAEFAYFGTDIRIN